MLKLDENLRKFRLQYKLTQEQLADIFDVSAQAVSRWENGTTYPDITLLPNIAGYFDISIDELLGFDIARKEERIIAILRENKKLHNNGNTKKSIELLRQGLADFPNEPRLLYCLAQSLYSLHFQSGEIFSEADRKNAALEAVELLKRSLRYADENFDDGGGCRQLLVLNYIKLGNYEKAKETALKAPFMPACREMLYAQTLTGKEAAEEYQKKLLHFAIGVYHSITEIRNRENYSDEQRIEISLMAKKFLLLIGGENSGFNNLFWNTLQILKVYIKNQNREKTLEYLEKALQYARDYEKRPDKTKYNVPWLCFCEKISENRLKHSQSSLYNDLLDFISQQNLNKWIKDDNRFEKIILDCKACL